MTPRKKSSNRSQIFVAQVKHFDNFPLSPRATNQPPTMTDPYHQLAALLMTLETHEERLRAIHANRLERALLAAAAIMAAILISGLFSHASA
jgi:hypothetical protein